LIRRDAKKEKTWKDKHERQTKTREKNERNTAELKKTNKHESRREKAKNDAQGFITMIDIRMV